MKENPLVSVVVITYNSSQYILETLKSIKAQTYSNIELIITDDCSTDDTVSICRDWLEQNKGRFVRTELVTSFKNTGIPANCNRGFRLTRGEWIKGIAGDDLLVEDGINQFIQEYKGYHSVVVGNYKRFFVNEEGRHCYDPQIMPLREERHYYELDVRKQYTAILNCCFVTAPAVFFRKSLFHQIGYFDEKYELMEDYPFWLKCLSSGFKIDYISILLVYYRYNHGSVTSDKEKFYNNNFYKCELDFKRNKIYPNVPVYNILYWQNETVMYLRYFVLYCIFNNKKNKVSIFLNYLILGLSIQNVLRRIKSYLYGK